MYSRAVHNLSISVRAHDTRGTNSSHEPTTLNFDGWPSVCLITSGSRVNTLKDGMIE